VGSYIPPCHRGYYFNAGAGISITFLQKGVKDGGLLQNREIVGVRTLEGKKPK